MADKDKKVEEAVAPEATEQAVVVERVGEAEKAEA
jgi:hypothetical protein